MQYKIVIPCEECYEWDEENVSVCCGSPFCFPGWPDSDLCSACGEHSEPWECEACGGTGEIEEHIKLPKIIADELTRNKKSGRIRDRG